MQPQCYTKMFVPKKSFKQRKQYIKTVVTCIVYMQYYEHIGHHMPSHLLTEVPNSQSRSIYLGTMLGVAHVGGREYHIA